jgi:acetylornithine deacetylase/succinyl-diaminopimelate desuccinylase-like protein
MQNSDYYGGEKHLPVIGYGPGEERLAHIVDEYIEESDLYRIKRGMKAIVEALLD